MPGRKVLDLGCVDHELGAKDVPWLHGHICELTDDVLGVDIEADQVEKLRRRGFNAVCADVQTMDLGRRFEVVVAGDIIEHLSAPGALFERAREHLAPGGLLLVATPNPLTLDRFVRALLTGRVRANRQHTCWFTAKVLRQLADRYGFEVVDESYIDNTRIYHRLWPRLPRRGGPVRSAWRRVRTLVKRLSWRPVIWLNSLLCLLRPRCAETLCMSFRFGGQRPEQA